MYDVASAKEKSRLHWKNTSLQFLRQTALRSNVLGTGQPSVLQKCSLFIFNAICNCSVSRCCLVVGDFSCNQPQLKTGLRATKSYSSTESHVPNTIYPWGGCPPASQILMAKTCKVLYVLQGNPHAWRGGMFANPMNFTKPHHKGLLKWVSASRWSSETPETHMTRLTWWHISLNWG